MGFLLLHIIVIIARLIQVKSAPVAPTSKNEALYFDEVVKTLHYMEKNPETIPELLSDGAVEGDILLSNDRNAVKNTWPTHDIAYVIDAEISSRTNDILKAMKMISDNTCLRFHPRTTETDFLNFQNSPGCASYVGFIGGAQPVFMGSVCGVGNVVHEILHALGFFHEHTREDRDQHIKILPNNIMTGNEKNFKKQHGNTLNIPYDLHSIMHYGRVYFSSNGLPTIVPLYDASKMGQREKLTELDIERVRKLYGCDSTKNDQAPV